MSRLQTPLLHLTVRTDLSEIGRIAAQVEAFCAERGLGDEVAQAVNLSLDELLTNTISYGYDDAAGHVIDVELATDGDRLTVVLRDDARAFDPTEAETPDLDADLDDRPLGGLGIHLVRSFMDDVSYSRSNGYNLLTLTKFIRA
jgi:anti-sigma regulatory factor (Ser/Thr protein kinase)